MIKSEDVPRFEGIETSDSQSQQIHPIPSEDVPRFEGIETGWSALMVKPLD